MNSKAQQGVLSFFVLIGDAVVLCVSLWTALFLRYLEKPAQKIFYEHIGPFSLLFIIWLLIFYIVDLYGRSFYLREKSLLIALFKSQIVNSLIAVSFFYLFDFFSITPKVVLFINLIVSFLLLWLWRLLIGYLLNLKIKKNLVLIGEGQEFEALVEQLKKNGRYGFSLIAGINSRELEEQWKKFEPEQLRALLTQCRSLIFSVKSFENLSPAMTSRFYGLMFRGVEFLDFHNFYESIFQSTPLSFINNEWFLANISSARRGLYDLLKRTIDIFISLIFGLISLLFYPFIILAIKIDDGGPVFYINPRLGQNKKIFQQIKFRSMCLGADARWPEKNDKRITRIGKFLRQTRLDELPQLWNVFWGDMSFVGPRPDFAEFAKVLEEKIPHYNIRNLIKPGLTGWAQILQKSPASIEETYQRLAYDIYYIKNRSLLLDIAIVLKTIRIIFSRIGV